MVFVATVTCADVVLAHIFQYVRRWESSLPNVSASSFGSLQC